MHYSLRVSFTLIVCSGSSPSPTIDLRFGLCEIFKHAHLKFTVYDHKQASKQTSIHTHVCNAVTLMWGSLRLVQTRSVKTLTYTTEPTQVLLHDENFPRAKLIVKQQSSTIILQKHLHGSTMERLCPFLRFTKAY